MRFVIFLLLALSSAVRAEPIPQLAAGERWLTIASAPDLNAAKGIADHFRGEDAKIVSSESGYYAVVFGPFKAKSIAAIKKKRLGLSGVPRDAILSRGNKYKEIVWRETASPLLSSPLAGYALGKPLQLAADGLNVTVSALPDAEDKTLGGSTVVVGERNGAEVFRFTFGADVLAAYGADAGFVKLDPFSEGQQLIVTRYSGGTHCCTEYWFITKPKDSSGWVLVQGATLDGGGYFFRDLDGDGAFEMLNADNRFLYAFDSYAASFAPLQAWQLRGSSITEVTDQAIANDFRAENLAFIDFATKINPDVWNSNGFLAAWVAVQTRAGNGDEAWRTLLENYDRESTFGPMICTTGEVIEQCPEDKVQTLPFPKALAQFLRDNGFGPIPDAAQSLIQ